MLSCRYSYEIIMPVQQMSVPTVVYDRYDPPDILGEEGKMYIPYLMTVVIYIGIANIFGVFGFVPPTKDLNCTIGLAITSIFLIEYAGFHKEVMKKTDTGFQQKLFLTGVFHTQVSYEHQ